MLKIKVQPAGNVTLGIGFYTVPEAARLLKIPGRNIARWLGGYSHHGKNGIVDIPPLWTPELPGTETHLEMSFRDLIELRFIQAFIKAGLGLKSIRHCLAYARECVNDPRPFSTQSFQTDGRTIFLDSANHAGASELLDLKKQQYVLKQVIERSLKDLDIEGDAVVRWRPFRGKDSIIIDPARAFGQPVASAYGVQTIALAQAVTAEASLQRVAKIYEVPVGIVRDAVKFEEYLMAA